VKIFLSYRAGDMQGQAPLIAGKIVQRLTAHYGNGSVITSPPVVPEGVNFDDFIAGTVGRSDVLLAIIGPAWTGTMQRLVNDSQDFVREEIVNAIRLRLPVVPVLLDDTPMPSAEELPPGLSALVEMQRFRLSTGTDMAAQLQQLTHHLDSNIRPPARTPVASVAPARVQVQPAIPARPHADAHPKKGGSAAAFLWSFIIFLAVGALWFLAPRPKSAPPAPPERDKTNDYLNSIGDRMVWCVPGTFQMGSPETEVGHAKDELQHEVTLTQGFWMGAHEITQAQWKLVTGEYHASFTGPREKRKAAERDENTAKPVSMVSWEESMAFCKLLSAQEGRDYQLPTEAQWEYACRAGTTGPQNREGIPLDDLAWHEGNSGGVAHLVGEKIRNNWGLQDMHGNVFEWCQDWYAPYTSEPVTDPKGPESGEFRIYRGSAFDIGNPYHRSAYRSWNKPDRRALNLGLRIVALPHGNAAATSGTPKGQAQAPGLFADQPAATQLNRREDEIAPEVKVRFLYCPPGAFTMGERSAAHEVTFTKGFWLGESEISRGQWRAVMGNRGETAGPNRGTRVPVDHVSWDDIAGRGGFLEKIQAKAPAGWQFAVPTEAQWEYACRAGTRTAYWWGDDLVPGKANISNAPGTEESRQSAYFESKGLPTGGSMAVKSLEPNPWGFYDMPGNVWEWCQDWFTETPATGPQTDPTGPASGDLKVLRGGSWSDPEAQAKSSARLRYFSTFRGATFGFRLALIPKS
jgi:formylglycine-generating enzyme required for sulfatase activity